MSTHYSVVIQWSDEDQTYIISLPEWGDLVYTHGDTYEDALKSGQELLQGLIDARQRHGEPLPEPRVYTSA
jgi:antitoxin HicB